MGKLLELRGLAYIQRANRGLFPFSPLTLALSPLRGEGMLRVGSADLLAPLDDGVGAGGGVAPGVDGKIFAQLFPQQIRHLNPDRQARMIEQLQSRTRIAAG